jgi:hypothetical protein
MLIRHLLPIVLLVVGNPVLAGSAMRPARLEGMDYDHARSVILGYGWTPFRDECGGITVTESTCARYPELRYCSGTGRGFCAMKFTKADRCLYLTTVESPPGCGGYTIIHHVQFRRSACQRDSI